MSSSCGRYVLVYNGEVYNFRLLRAELEREGRVFRGSSDTEVVVEAIGCWGVIEAVRRLQGMFTIAVWDARERLLHLARDRFGEKPLYHAWDGRTFLFASELRALLVYPDFSPPVDPDAVALYLRYKSVPAPRSILQGVAKLEPATLLTLGPGDGPGNERVSRYWSLADVVEAGAADPFPGSAQDAADELDELLRDAVAMRLEADVPLGAFLSGGVDSSTVVAHAAAASPHPVRTFTVGFAETRYDEAPFARAVAAHLGTDHTQVDVSPTETLEVVPELPVIYDEPFGDSSQVPTVVISRLARRRVTVCLSGDGGDELFGGYLRYGDLKREWNRVSRLPRPVRHLAAAALGGERGMRLRAYDDPVAAYRTRLANWRDPSEVVVGTVGPDPSHRIRLPRGAETPPAMAMYADALTYLPDDILVKVDRAAMSVGLETRLPMLDERIVAFAWRLPEHLRTVEGGRKPVLRGVLARYVPPELTDRPKAGFSVPVGAWLRGPLSAWADELLDPRRIDDQGILHAGVVRRVWQDHREGRADHAARLWSLLMLQAWMERR